MHVDKSAIPAPGQYAVNASSIGKSGVVIGERLPSVSNLKTPGAGAYESDCSPIKH